MIAMSISFGMYGSAIGLIALGGSLRLSNQTARLWEQDSAALFCCRDRWLHVGRRDLFLLATEIKRAPMIEPPRPAVTFADHSYPAYSQRQMQDYAAASVAAERERCAIIAETQYADAVDQRVVVAGKMVAKAIRGER